MKNIFKKIFLFLLLGLFFLPVISRAAEISLSSDSSVFANDKDFLVEVFFNAGQDKINAVEGQMTFPADLLELKEVRDGNSVVNFWIEKPHENGSGVISFSGITAGGFSGSKSLLFGLVFHAKALGQGNFGWSNMEALLNDGQGTKTEVKNVPFPFVIRQSGDTAQDISVRDEDPPESFTPALGSDPSIFGGKYFVVWSTVDKGSGIDHYEVREGFFGTYKNAESPYVLEDQSLKKALYVKAIDRSGNVRVEKIGPFNHFYLYVWFAIIAVILAALFLTKKSWARAFTR